MIGKIEDYFNKDCVIIDEDEIIYEGLVAGREYDLETNETLGIFLQTDTKQEFISIEKIKKISEVSKNN